LGSGPGPPRDAARPGSCPPGETEEVEWLQFQRPNEWLQLQCARWNLSRSGESRPGARPCSYWRLSHSGPRTAPRGGPVPVPRRARQPGHWSHLEPPWERWSRWRPLPPGAAWSRPDGGIFLKRVKNLYYQVSIYGQKPSRAGLGSDFGFFWCFSVISAYF